MLRAGLTVMLPPASGAIIRRSPGARLRGKPRMCAGTAGVYRCPATTGSSTHHHPCIARLWTRLADHVSSDEGRTELAAGLSGRVIEIGAGDGRSFAHYPSGVTEIVAIEPEPYLRRRAEHAARALPREITVLAGAAEDLALEASSFDAAVSSLVLCSVDDQAAALAELHRVLKPGGELRFLEHVIADHAPVRTVQTALDRSGLWPRVSGGCHLARDSAGAIRAAGFEIVTVRRADLGAISRSVPFLFGRALREPA